MEPWLLAFELPGAEEHFSLKGFVVSFSTDAIQAQVGGVGRSFGCSGKAVSATLVQMTLMLPPTSTLMLAVDVPVTQTRCPGVPKGLLSF